jgi:hypothetical protein
MVGFNIEQLLTFPVKDPESRNNFFIGTLIYLAGFIIPILPMFVATGGVVKVMRKALRGEEPRMPSWEDWNSMFKDGGILYGVSLIYSIPLLILMIPILLGIIFLPYWNTTQSGSNEILPWVTFFTPGLIMLFFIPASIAIGFLTPIATTHVIARDNFAAGFRFREWWQVLRANPAGFILAYIASITVSTGLIIVVQFAMMTIVLICVLPLIMPAITLYSMLVMYTAYAQAYVDGRNLLTP